MRKGQKQYIDKIEKKKDISEDTKRLFYDESYTIEEYGMFYSNIDVKAKVLANHIHETKDITPSWKRHIVFYLICHYSEYLNKKQIEMMIDFDDIIFFLKKTKDIETAKKLLINYESELDQIKTVNIYASQENDTVLKKKRQVFIYIISNAINKKIGKDLFNYLDILFDKQINEAKLEILEYFILHNIPCNSFLKISNDISNKDDPQFALSELLYNNWKILLDKYIHKDEFIKSGYDVFQKEKHCSDKNEEILKTAHSWGIKCEFQMSKTRMTIQRDAKLGNYILFTFIKYNKVYISQSNSESWSPENVFQIIMFSDGGIRYNYYNNKYPKKKFYPLSLKKLINEQEYYGPILSEFTHNLIDHFIAKGSLIAKDMVKYIDYNRFFVPGNINDIMLYHNKAEMMEKYRVFQNPNTSDINILYAINKSDLFVNEESKGILHNLKTLDSIYTDKYSGNCNFSYSKKHIRRSAVISFLTLVLSERVIKDKDILKRINMTDVTEDDINEIRNEMMTNIRDYVLACIENKIPVNLRFKSYQKVINEHQRITDEITLEQYKREAEDFTIPEKSKFRQLRKMLPDNFEWIQDKDRLALEATIMHHCVFQYSWKIANDICAIYSCFYEKENKRYTIEFLYSNGNYIINQIQSKYDRGCSQDFRNYLKELLNIS